MTRGTLTLVFDDGYQAVFDRVLPLLRRSGVRAVFAVPVETARVAESEGAPVVPLSAWKAVCAEQRHELAAHGVTHRALTSLPDEELMSELMNSREATGATTLVYPGGAHDDRVVAAARRYFRAARTVRWGYAAAVTNLRCLQGANIGGLYAGDPYRLRSFVATKDNFQVWKWNLRVLWAWLTNRWVIETFHNVSTLAEGTVFASGARAPRGVRGEAKQSQRGDAEIAEPVPSEARDLGLLAKTESPGDRHTIPLGVLDRHLRFVTRLPIRIATIREMI